jgi:hypothetical protein
MFAMQQEPARSKIGQGTARPRTLHSMEPSSKPLRGSEFLQRHLGNSFVAALDGALLQRSAQCACGGACGGCSDTREVGLSRTQPSLVAGVPDGFHVQPDGLYEQEVERGAHRVTRLTAPPDPLLSSGSEAALSREGAERAATAVNESDVQEEQTAMTGGTSGNRIDFSFDPRTTSPKPQCDEIVIVQTIQMTADGTPIFPGTYYNPWKCRDVAAISDGTYVDHPACSSATPYYTYSANGTPGSSNSVTTNATAFDAPLTGGGDKGFQSPSNPTGWLTVSYNFETYGFCAAGSQCGNWYEGIQWNYTKTATDHTAGRNGASTTTANLLPPGPGSRAVQAFDKFNKAKGFVPCTMSVGRT